MSARGFRRATQGKSASLLAFAVAFAVTFAVSAVASAERIELRAAGSLRAAMTGIVQAFVAAGGAPVNASYGASGLLRERIEKGEPADVFASADVGNPRSLARAGIAAPPLVFARNRLCALVAADMNVTTGTLLERMLNARIKLGTSTPKADPSGDYTWELLEKAEKLRPGAFRTLDAKALKLTGGRDSPAPPADRWIYALMLAERKADIFLTYCTNALQVIREMPAAQMIAVPAELTVGAEYGLTLMKGATPAAERFDAFVLSPSGQAILVEHGFAPASNP